MATTFLVPETALFEKIGRKRTTIHLDELFILKQEFGNNLQSLIKRCFELEVITKSTYVDFMGEFTKQGWKKKEPGDEVLPESSFRFQLLLRRAIAENLITQSQTMELQKLAADAKDLYKDEELTILTDSNVGDFYGYED